MSHFMRDDISLREVAGIAGDAGLAHAQHRVVGALRVRAADDGFDGGSPDDRAVAQELAEAALPR